MPFVVMHSYEGDVNPATVMIHDAVCPAWKDIMEDGQQLDWVTLPKVNTFAQAKGIAQDYVNRVGAREWTRGKCIP